MDIALIPARSGSKRIKGKNIKPFLGIPIMAYPIKAALASGCFDKVVVSTDSEEFGEVALSCGAEVILRPEELSDDHTPLAPVIEHGIKELQGQGHHVERACCILSTAPFVRPSDISRAKEMLVERNVGAVFSVTSFPFPIFRGLKMSQDGTVSMFWPEHELSRSNDLPDGYHDAGQFYWLDATKFLREKKVYMADALGFVLPRYLVQDIDTSEDWHRAELMYRVLQESGEVEL